MNKHRVVITVGITLRVMVAWPPREKVSNAPGRDESITRSVMTTYAAPPHGRKHG